MLRFGADRIFSCEEGQPPSDAELAAIIDRSITLGQKGARAFRAAQHLLEGCHAGRPHVIPAGKAESILELLSPPAASTSHSVPHKGSRPRTPSWPPSSTALSPSAQRVRALSGLRSISWRGSWQPPNQDERLLVVQFCRCSPASKGSSCVTPGPLGSAHPFSHNRRSNKRSQNGLPVDYQKW